MDKKPPSTRPFYLLAFILLALSLVMKSACIPREADDDAPSVEADSGASTRADTGGDTKNVSVIDPSDDTGTTPDTTSEPDTGTSSDTGTDDTYEDPCGNGTVDPGETCDGDCPTSCDDGDPCTTDQLKGDPDQCTAECKHTTDQACQAYTGSYSGRYYILAEEKAGSTVVNSMTCTGTFSADVDLTRDKTLKGSANCTYSGGLTAYDSSQSANLEGTIEPDGSFDAQLTHDFGRPNDGSFSISGSIKNGSLTVDDSGSYLPNSYSTVPWDVTIEFGNP